MKTYQKTCAVCGAEFVTNQHTRKSCGQKCGYVLRGLTHKASKQTEKGSPHITEGVAFVPLTQGKFAQVDESDIENVSQWNWSVWRDRSGREYAVRGQPLVYLHRHLLSATDVEKVDHKNGDGLDNRRSNLRKATYQENNRNRIKRRSGKSKYKGVSSHYDKWGASIWVDGLKFWLGRFDTEEEAARAYDEAARRHFSEFARVNFPIGDEQPALH